MSVESVQTVETEVGKRSESFSNYTRIIRCIFKDNVAQSEEAAYGGAIYSSHAPVDIVNSFFYNNSTRSAVDNNNGYNSQQWPRAILVDPKP